MNTLLSQMLGDTTCGDCIDVMDHLPSSCVDFILTDPPYLVNYRDRTGRKIAGDNSAQWLNPAFAQMHRLLRDDSFCVSFYGWNAIDLFMAAWKGAGFRVAGHIVFRKRYASSARFVQYQHEQAYLLIKGNPALPAAPIPDVLDWQYTGNRLHPTQKPVAILSPLIKAFCPPCGAVLDHLCCAQHNGSYVAASVMWCPSCAAKPMWAARGATQHNRAYRGDLPHTTRRF